MKLLLTGVLAVSCTPVLAQAPPEWEFSAAAYAYFVPQDTNYVQPTITADRGRLHLEARYNYEDRDTGSVWAGQNFSGGTKLEWQATPLVGVVLGDSRGVAVGYRGWLGWRGLELYSEGEYFCDSGGAEDFLYNWSELTFAPAEWFRFGLVAQRTRAHETERGVERGLLAGFTLGRVGLTGHVFDPADGDPTVIVSAAVGF